MWGSLEDSLRSDVRASESDTSLLASLARERVPALAGSMDDSDEDLVLRLRDPRIFGEFAASLAAEPRLSPELRRSLAEHAFDLLPLPRTEGDVILVDSRAPPRLLALASLLQDADEFTLLHAMHLVYAVFLDRSLVTNVARSTRAAVLLRLASLAEAGEDLRALYAALHLAALPEAEARASLEGLLESDDVPVGVRAILAGFAASTDGGRGRIAEIARSEGLLPPDPSEEDETSILANVPRLPPRLAALGRRWLAREKG